MNKLAMKWIAASEIEVDQRASGGESLPFDDGAFDCVVRTWTMCSIPGVDRALGEVYRVLRPGGRLNFLEHGMSEDSKVRAWQRRLNPMEGLLGDWCRLDLDGEEVVRGHPFRDVQIERFERERMPRTHGTIYRGSATK
jgi:ubiquinone/menaquinone biosynthesis C-methylase UbiE